MTEIIYFSGGSDWIDMDFVERERTPEPAIKLDIQLHLVKPPLSDTVFVFDDLDAQCPRKFVHDGVQKADRQPVSGKNPNHDAVDETVIRIDDQQFRLHAAVNPDTNEIRHLRLFPTTITALTERFLQELRAKHDVDDAVFFVDGANHLQAALQQRGLRF